MSLFEDIRRDRDAGTPGPWVGLNMVGQDGKPMSPDELGTYVRNCLKMSDLTRFLFVSGKHPDGNAADVCHVGNGPRGDANTARIARVPAMEAALLAAEELADASRRFLEFATDHARTGEVMPLLTVDHVQLWKAFAAYREATS